MIRLLALPMFALVSLACGPADAHPPIRPTEPPPAGLPYGMDVDILDEYGAPLPTATSGGRRYVLGEHGRRYIIKITNPSSRRVEVVVSVDGLDVIDGKPASLAKRGYVINPYGELRIEGWRTSLNSVAAFRFGRVVDSYAARTGSARNVGVIGVAVFAEARPRVERPLIPRSGSWHDESRSGGSSGSETEAFRKGAEGKRAKEAPQGRTSGSEDATTRRYGEEKLRAPAPPTKSASSPAPKGEAPSPERRSLAQSERWRRDFEDRPGLGTEFGEQRFSSVQYTTFVRQSSRPVGMIEIRYNDEQGLARLGIVFPPRQALDDDMWQRETANPFPVGGRFATPPPRRPWE